MTDGLLGARRCSKRRGNFGNQAPEGHSDHEELMRGADESRGLESSTGRPSPPRYSRDGTGRKEPCGGRSMTAP